MPGMVYNIRPYRLIGLGRQIFNLEIVGSIPRRDIKYLMEDE